MPEPRAYLLTWTTYGTWLPGDERGSVDEMHNLPGEAAAPASVARRSANRVAMTQGSMRLSVAAREVVRMAIVEHADFRGWDVRAVSVRPEHVHVVVRCGEEPPHGAMRKLKAWATRKLRLAGIVSRARHVWTERGSARWLWDAAAETAAVKYVLHAQGPE